MVQIPSREANRPTNSQIPRFLWNQDVRYGIYKKQPIVRVLSGMNSFHILSTSFFTIHFNITISAKETDTELVSELHYPLYTSRYCRTTLRTVHHQVLQNCTTHCHCIMRCIPVGIAELYYLLCACGYCKTALSAVCK